ncbi:MAG: hypothetical protein HQ517_10350 [SAR324 cluster bacterium]|nr:hypothetical protein [SAR324 cluster bacterium]
MRYFSIFLLVLGLTLQTGCTSQARKTHLVFENDHATYDELSRALEELKPVSHEGDAHQQYKAVKALRHIAKYMRDPAKRELGVRGLVFLVAFTDDGDVEESAESRLDAILGSKDEELALKVAVLNEKKNVVIGKTGYSVDDSSVFSSKAAPKFIYPESSAREDALEFLKDRFEDSPEYLQFIITQAFGEILNNPTICFEMDEGKCEDDDSEDQAEWRNDLREDIGDWLEESALSEMIKTALVRTIAESVETAENDEERSKIKSLMEGWIKGVDTTALTSSANFQETPGSYVTSERTIRFDIPEKTREIIKAALDKMENHHPDLVDPAASASSIGKATFKADESYQRLEIFDKNAFWYANSAKILDRQLFNVKKTTEAERTKKTANDDNFMQVPAEWLFYDGFSSGETTKALREIIYYNAREALSKGYLLTYSQDQQTALGQIMTAAASESKWALDRSLSVIAKVYPSLYQHQEDIQELVDFITGRLSAEPDIHTKRLYYFTLLEGLPYFESIIEPALCSSLNNADLLTRQMVKEKVSDLLAPTELLSTAKHRKMQAAEGQATDSKRDMAGEDNAPYIKSFCGEELTRKVSSESEAEKSTEEQKQPPAEQEKLEENKESFVKPAISN